ncbi:hypothetical protein [Prevotella sp. tc2-28]|uniref:hypothetical protein n=1 Tax=Prevotella sp. tc2-28 TaxID=1761888 RepID=UPI0011600AAB|nr:hypothetical protein [Prevotella sp. tc2-28]
MEQAIINEIIAALVAAVVMYVGFINNLRTDVRLLKEKSKSMDEKCKEMTDEVAQQMHLNTILEEKVKKMETRQESHSKKYDELLNTINELKIEMVKQFSRLTSELNSFNSMVEASDKGVKIKKNKK